MVFLHTRIEIEDFWSLVGRRKAASDFSLEVAWNEVGQKIELARWEIGEVDRNGTVSPCEGPFCKINASLNWLIDLTAGTVTVG